MIREDWRRELPVPIFAAQEYISLSLRVTKKLKEMDK